MNARSKAALERWLLQSRLTLAQFATSLSTDAVHALQFVGAVVPAAAQVRVFSHVLRAERENTQADRLLAHARERVRLMASTGAVRSTSPLDAPLHAEELRAWTMVVELLEAEGDG